MPAIAPDRLAPPLSYRTMAAPTGTPWQSAAEGNQATVAAPPAPPPPANTGDSGGEIVVEANPLHTPGDPLERVNAKSFAATQAADKALVRPVAMAYKHDLPKPVRSGLRNFLNNLREPEIFLNFLLQLKPGKAAETLGRFAINSTVGLAGLIDVAKRKPFHLPQRANGFADTLGYYGVKPGPFLFLPLIGPTTLRDLVGNGIDRMLLPVAIGKPFTDTRYATSTNVLRSVDHRAQFDERFRKMQASDDPYASARSFYLHSRQAEIDALHGRGRNDAFAAYHPPVLDTTLSPGAGTASLTASLGAAPTWPASADDAALPAG
ncbi:VacJ family lipoprotein [Sphingomonadaceae bacterium LXI357]|uniref:VacJ family lipoprotein n=2 Tax=Stakelama marina TaxID=2826939 RepID=A0A8T4IJ07_9SPHN|nr:VacJ family lipoprotein [Stakelama marina]